MNIELKFEDQKDEDQSKYGSLKSYGFNCYLNVTIQMLFSITIFRSFILSCELKQQCKVTTPLKEVFSRLIDGKSTAESQTLFESIGWEKRQHDASEAVEFVLTVMNDKLNDSMKWREICDSKFSIDGEENIMTSIRESSYDAESLEDAMSRQTNLFARPSTLIIHIDRVTPSGINKVVSKLSFPIDFDAGKILKGSTPNCKLQSIILLIGSAVSGHYVTLVKHD